MQEAIVILIVLLVTIFVILAGLSVLLWWLERRQRSMAQQGYDNLWSSRQPSPSTDGGVASPTVELVIKS